jgi:hypothetical protein
MRGPRLILVVFPMLLVGACSPHPSAAAKTQYERWKVDWTAVERGVADAETQPGGESPTQYGQVCVSTARALNKQAPPLIRRAPTHDLAQAAYAMYRTTFRFLSDCWHQRLARESADLVSLRVAASRMDERMNEADKHFGVSGSG